MRRFLINTLIFSLLTILILGMGELLVRHLPSSYSTKHAYLLNHGQRINTLILGSSHTYYGISPDIMGDSVFNLANISQTPEYDLYLLKHYLHLMPNLKQVIVPVSYFTYRDPEMEKGPDKLLAIPYKTRMHLPIHSGLSTYNLEITDFDSFRGKLTNLILHKPSNQCDSLGFGLGFDLKHRDSSWEKAGKERSVTHTLTTPGRYNDVVSIQKELIATAKKAGAEVVFITTPTWHTYYKNLEPAQLNEMYEGITDITRDKSVRYYDFLKDSRFDDADFHDTDHLSDIGARKFTKLLSDTLSVKIR